MLLTGSTSDPPSVAAARLQQIIEARFAHGLDEARAIFARGAQADPEELRIAYLDLLKLCLCDLGGATTASVVRTQQGHVMSRELAGEQLRLRAAGMDWPLRGLTMIGLRRLDDLQGCVETIVRDEVPGDLIEAGSWRGGASLLMRATLDSCGATERTVWVSDSFQGFPRADGDLSAAYDLSVDLAGVDFLAIPLEEVRESFARLGCDHGVEFVPGFFQDTLPGLRGRQWSLIRLDGDTYDSIMVALRSLYAGLAPGGFLVVDDYLSLDQCREAVEDFRREHCIVEPIEEIDWSGVRWRRAPDAEPIAVTPPTDEDRRSAQAAPAPCPVERGPRARVPAIEEVELSEELERLRTRLAAAEGEIARLTASPLQGPKRWLRGKLGRMRGAS
jgi:O-methyltransferase